MSDKALPTLEFRIPISPNEKYMRMLHYFVESLQTFGGKIARNAHCLVVVGEDTEPWDLKQKYSWTKNYSIEFVWVERETFRKDTYDATGYIRLDIKSDADIIALVDADLLFAGDFDEVIIESYQKQCVLGFIAHVSPFKKDSQQINLSSENWWEKIFTAAQLPKPKLEFEHTGWGLMYKTPGHRYCPAYYNYGFILAPQNFVEKMGKSYLRELDAVDSVLETWFKSQIANTLTFARYDLPCATLPINYNFPLHVPCNAIRELNPDPKGKNSYEDIKIFHYLGKGEVNKEHFTTQKSLEEILQRKNMSSAGTVFQQKLKIVHNRISDTQMDISAINLT